MSTDAWRFLTVDVPHQAVPTVYRGRAYRLPEYWTSDSWRHYWEDTEMVVFIDGGYRHGTYAVTENEETERAITAYRWSGEEALARLAARLNDQHPGARFICVGLDRGTDCYALAWSGDEDNEWRDEIEAVWHGDIWRAETEVYDGTDWQPADDMCEEWYGEDKAQAAFAEEFPLTEFPAELFIGAASEAGQ